MPLSPLCAVVSGMSSAYSGFGGVLARSTEKYPTTSLGYGAVAESTDKKKRKKRRKTRKGSKRGLFGSTRGVAHGTIRKRGGRRRVKRSTKKHTAIRRSRSSRKTIRRNSKPKHKAVRRNNHKAVRKNSKPNHKAVRRNGPFVAKGKPQLFI